MARARRIWSDPWTWQGAVAALALTIIAMPAGLYSQGPPAQKPAAEHRPLIPLPLSVENQAWLDRDIYRGLKTVINTGADLYNQESDRAGCYRLYQGALTALRPLLDHHPDLQKVIHTGPADAAGKPSVAARAFALRAVLDEIRARLKPSFTTSDQEPPRAVPAKPVPVPDARQGAKPKDSPRN